MSFFRKSLVFAAGLFLLSSSLWSTKPATEAVERMTKLLGEGYYDEDMEVIPSDINGLGYMWYPIVIKYENPEIAEKVKITVRPCDGIRWRLDEEKIHDENDIIKQTVGGIFERSHPAFYKIAAKHNFLDPKEVTDAITAIKSKETFSGFMHAMDLLELEIDGEKVWFNDGSERKIRYDRISDYSLLYRLKPMDNPDGRIFNHMIEIDIRKTTP